MIQIRPLDVVVAFALAVLVASSGCPAPTPPPAPAVPGHDPFADRAAVVEAHEAFLAAMERGDGAAVGALLHDGHDLLIFHPAIETRFDGPEAIEAGVGRMLAATAPLDLTEVHLQVWVDGDIAWLTSHLLLETPRRAEPFAGRGTEIWRRTDAGWRLAHGHWSEHPVD